MKFSYLVILLLVSLLVSGCGDSQELTTARQEQQKEKEKADSVAQEPLGPSAADWVRFTRAHPGAKGSWETLIKAAGRRAKDLLLPSGRPPAEIVIRDLQVGKGPVIEFGDEFTSNYMALNYADGSVAQNQWGRFTFKWEYAHEQLVKALVVGMKGMRVGGLRELVAPSAFAYGNGALVYLVKLRKLE
jgi:peptidylprolyl isomerase